MHKRKAIDRPGTRFYHPQAAWNKINKNLPALERKKYSLGGKFKIVSLLYIIRNKHKRDFWENRLQNVINDKCCLNDNFSTEYLSGFRFYPFVLCI